MRSIQYSAIPAMSTQLQRMRLPYAHIVTVDAITETGSRAVNAQVASGKVS